MVSETTVPTGSFFLPALGLLVMTVPFANFEEVWQVIVPIVQKLLVLWSRFLAFARGLPGRNFGTLQYGGPRLTVIATGLP